MDSISPIVVRFPFRPRSQVLERRSMDLTPQAWICLQMMCEDAAIAARLAMAECDRELDSGAAAEAEKDAVFFEGILAAVRGGAL